MGAMTVLAFEDHMVRAVQRGGAPWFVGKDVCAALSIKNHIDALGALDEDEKGVASTDPLGAGGEQTAVIVSEPGVYRLVFRSRKPEAERFKRWLAHDVLPELRRTGGFASPDLEKPEVRPGGDPAGEPLLHRLYLLDRVERLFGKSVAQVMYRKLGLPDVPPPPPSVVDEARACLRHIVSAPVHEGGPRIRDVLALAIDEDENARLLLLASGIRPEPERDGFVVANRHPALARVLKGTEWAGPLVAVRLLKRLPGAAAGGQHRWPGLPQPILHGVFVPADALDEFD